MNIINKDKHIYISIFLHNKGFIPAGVISYNLENNYSSFSYFTSYIENNYPPLNPSTLNYRDKKDRHFPIDTSSNYQFLDRTFWELLPNTNDWGNQVILSKYPEYGNMNNAEKLYFLKKRTVGGLLSYIKESSDEENIEGLDWLDKVYQESVEFYLKNTDKISYLKAFNPLTSYGGMRPKCTFLDEEGDFWIAKFNLPNDHYNMAKAEQIAMDMSRDCGLNTSDSKIITLPSGEDVFLSKRFDRTKNERVHTLSLFALGQGNLACKNNDVPGNPSSFIQTLIRRYSDFKDQDTANILVKMLLDIGTNNTDNHLRNLRILLNKEYKWELSPIYDVVFNPFNQPYTYNPANLPLSEIYLNNNNLVVAMAQELGLSQELVLEKMKKVKQVVSKWEDYCDKYRVNPKDKQKIGNAVSLGMNRRELEIDLTIENKIKTIRNIPKLKPKI